jgi:hypothetical protein
MIGLSAAFANTVVRFYWKDKLIRFPEIAITLTAFVHGRDVFPELNAAIWRVRRHMTVHSQRLFHFS